MDTSRFALKCRLIDILKKNLTKALTLTSYGITMQLDATLKLKLN